ncbi:type IV pilus modification PilV family protein [Vibrio sinaloensis]|uniref:type IV pilus modification PilV family protein n=1 Tax=Photobacterium sp. (strain ATCC 43367) TaxID=379097 RepID=UPI00205E322D|nr:type II secretion system protein [Vibrio sinaloensis]UPQ88300.1 type II secretion system GspH family protein [Vibrio sinaloensis]
MKSKRSISCGFTLIESVIVIVIMGLAMITIVNFLAPQIARSADPHYQTRVAALGQSVMTQILARGFDHHSDFQGGRVRCSSLDLGSTQCSGFGSSSRVLGIDSDRGETVANPLQYDDVDDFIGCWTPGATNGCRDLNALLADGGSSYANFRLDIAVQYANGAGATLKQVTLTIAASNQPAIRLVGYRGNY